MPAERNQSTDLQYSLLLPFYYIDFEEIPNISPRNGKWTKEAQYFLPAHLQFAYHLYKSEQQKMITLTLCVAQKTPFDLYTESRLSLKFNDKKLNVVSNKSGLP